MEDLKTPVRRSDVSVSCEILRCAAVVSNCLNAVETRSSWAFLVSEKEVCDVSPKGDGDH